MRSASETFCANRDCSKIDVHVVASGGDADDGDVGVGLVGPTVNGPQSPMNGHGKRFPHSASVWRVGGAIK